MLDKKVFINLPFELVLGSSWAAWTIGSGTGVWTWAEIGACLGAGLAAAALPKKFNKKEISSFEIEPPGGASNWIKGHKSQYLLRV